MVDINKKNNCEIFSKTLFKIILYKFLKEVTKDGCENHVNTKAEKIIIFAKQAAIPAVCSFVIFCLFLSTISRLDDFFFKSFSQRYLIIFGILIIAALFFNFIWKLSKNRNFQHAFTFLDNILPFFAIALIITIVTLLSEVIPMPKIPINHTLKIHALPPEDGSGNLIFLQKITETIDAPQKGSVDVDFDLLKINDGRHERKSQYIQLEENAVLYYNSFYSGCISILFITSPDSKKVQVHFDKTADVYSLRSQDMAPTTVDMCSQIPVENLSFKWKIIVLGLYMADFISIFAIVGLIALLINILLFEEEEQTNKIQHQFILYLSTGIIVVSVILQIGRIVFFPDETITRAPSAKPQSVARKLTLWNVYEVALHRKRFSTSFPLAFMDIYPCLEQVYVDSTTWDVFGFDNIPIERWLGLYGLQLGQGMEIEPDRQKVEELIDFKDWNVKKIPVDNEGVYVLMKYQKEKPDSYVYVTNRGETIYVIPDTLIDERY